jgi:cytochrome c peroxidase
VQDSPTLDPLLKNGNALGISLNDDEKLVLIAFLGTLTDDEFITDKRFAEY